MELSFLAWDETIAAGRFAVLEGADTKEIKNLHPLQRSAAVSASPAEGTIRLRALDKKSAEGKPIDFAVKIDAAITHPLVLLLPDAKAPAGVTGLVIEDNTTSFPWGSFRLLNATGKSMAFGLGTERKMLPAGWKPVDVKPSGSQPLPVWFALPVEPVKPLYTAVWPVDPNTRRLVILVPSTEARLGPLALKVIPEDRRTDGQE